MSRKAFKYRIEANRATSERLQWVLDRARELYNAALTERRDAYEMHIKNPIALRQGLVPSFELRYVPVGRITQAGVFTSLTRLSLETDYDIGSVKERTNGCEASPLLYNAWVNQP